MMNPTVRLLMILGCLLPACGHATEIPVDEILTAAAAAEHAQDPARALELFRQANQQDPDNPVILQKISQQLSDTTSLLETREAKSAQLHEALTYAQRAADLAPDSAVNVLSVAICYGKLGLYGDTSTKVEYCRKIKEYADRALALDPDYAWAHHVLGKWHYEVAKLGGAKRFFAGLLYGSLPKGTYAEAILHLQKAVELDPQEVTHYIELGFAYAAVGQTEKARTAWNQALALPSSQVYHDEAKARARAALADSPD